MSYCRMSKHSDVYMLPTKDGILCCACKLTNKIPELLDMHDNVIFSSPKDAFEHLLYHTQVGHKVPLSALTRLQNEIRRNHGRNK